MKYRTTATTAIAIGLACGATAALADHPSIAFGSEGVGALNTISATPLAAGSWGAGLRVEAIDNDEFTTEQLEQFAADGLEGVHSTKSMTSTSLSLAYGATDNFTISARLPYIERKNIREGELEGGTPEAHTHGDSAGLGDLLLLGQYRFHQREDLDAAILLGVKAPTGETDVTDDDGARFETEFQPGSGSWDFLFGASVSQRCNSVGLHANILFSMTTEGAQATELGDAFAYNAAVTYRLNYANFADDHDHDHTAHSHGAKWDLSLELNGELRQKNRIGGELQEHSGGNTVYVSPGIRVSSEYLSAFVAYGIPVVQDPNGTQTDVDRRIVAGASIAF